MKMGLALSWMLIGLISLKTSAEMTMRNVQIQNCTSKGNACLLIKSPIVQVSEIKMIFYMQQVEIEIKDPSSAEPTEKFQRRSGVLDLESNQLVFSSVDASGTLTEEAYNLKTLHKQIFKTR